MDIIKNDETANVGGNIRRLRLEKGMKQIELVREVQLMDVDLTRETLVKIERGIQHVKVAQLKAIRHVLDTTYEELLK